MAECVKIFVEIPVDSEIYKKAVELSNKNKDLGFMLYSTPEKVLQSCLELGSNPHISNNEDFLSQQADKYRKEYNK